MAFFAASTNGTASFQILCLLHDGEVISPRSRKLEIILDLLKLYFEDSIRECYLSWDVAADREQCYYK
jgi:hypothetical protein